MYVIEFISAVCIICVILYLHAVFSPLFHSIYLQEHRWVEISWNLNVHHCCQLEVCYLIHTNGKATACASTYMEKRAQVNVM